MPNQHIYPKPRIHTHHAEQLLQLFGSKNPADLPQALTAFLDKHLAPKSHPPTMRYNCQTYELLAHGLETCPGHKNNRERWGETHSLFRRLSRADGWCVYGLPKTNSTN